MAKTVGIYPHFVHGRKKVFYMSMNFERKLPIPQEVKEQYPITRALSEIIDQRAAEIKDIFAGK